MYLETCHHCTSHLSIIHSRSSKSYQMHAIISASAAIFGFCLTSIFSRDYSRLGGVLKGIAGAKFLLDGCLFCHPTISVNIKAPKRCSCLRDSHEPRLFHCIFLNIILLIYNKSILFCVFRHWIRHSLLFKGPVFWSLSFRTDHQQFSLGKPMRTDRMTV